MGYTMPAFAGFCRSRWTRMMLVGLLAIIALLGGSLVTSPTAKAAAGGPIVLMGIDAEDGGPGGHGPISVYESVLNDILGKVTNGGAGILVIGAGKAAGDSPTAFWNQIDADLPEAVTLVNGAAAITAQSFAGFKVIAVVSDEGNTPGGLTAAEHAALSARQADVAAFVNGGGGLLGFTSDFANPYAYLGGVGAFTATTGLGYDNITATPAGSAIGITDALDVCCWHDEFTAFPAFLSVLATNAATGQPAAIGGANVVVSNIQLAPATAQNPVGTSHTLTATVTENGAPKSGVTVTFTVVSGPHAGTTGTGTTNASGEATFSYTGTTAGTDTIEASFVDGSGNTQTSNQVTKEWIVVNKPPECGAATPSVETIWPPNHKFVTVEVLGVTDPDGDPLTIQVDSIRQDEPVDNYGDGRFTPDGKGVGTATAQLRAERAGTPKVPGNGRVYHIGFTASDGKGGTCSGTVKVAVPHDQRGAPAVDDGPLYDSTATAP
jgi:Bacterial Ig-like domain (group 1)